jgi:hypothetical protein
LITALLFVGRLAHGESPASGETAETSPESRFALRGELGVGGGEVGLGTMEALRAEYWFGAPFGLAVEAGYLSQQALELFGDENRSSARFGGAAVGVRSAPTRRYFFATMGAAYGSTEHVTRESSGFSLSGTPPPPRPERVTLQSPFFMTATMGGVWNPIMALQAGVATHVFVGPGEAFFWALCLHVGGAI